MSLVSDFELNRQLHLQHLGNLTGGVPAGLPAQLEELKPTLAAFEAETQKIAADANLSAIGKHTALQTARATATAAIETWTSGRAAGVSSQMAALEAVLAEKTAKGRTPPSEIRLRVMVDKLSPLDQLEVSVLYSDASEEERLVIEHAVEVIGRVPRRRPDNQVVWESLMPQERVLQMQAARQERADPAVAASLRDLTRIGNTYSALASAATSLLGK